MCLYFSRKRFSFYRLFVFSLLIFIAMFSGNVLASESDPIGLDFPALLEESINLDGASEEGLLVVARKNTWDTVPENHEELVRCVEEEASWAPDYAGFKTFNGTLWWKDNPFGEDENYTFRFDGFFYVEEGTEGSWSFCTYSKDASEIEIDGQVIADWYGEHDGDDCYHGEHSGSIPLETGWHHFVYRYAMGTGSDYCRVDFKDADDSSWKRFSADNLTLTHYPFEEGILLINRKNTAESHPDVDGDEDNHDLLENYVDDTSEADVDYFGWGVVDTISQTENIHGEDTNYTSYYETYFEVTDDTEGEWSFAVNSTGASDLAVDETVVAAWYGDHTTATGDYSHSGTVTLETGWHKLVLRQETLADAGAAYAYFKNPSDTDWSAVATDNLTLKTYAADLDLDGLHNDIEAILGTDMENRDTDFETLNDYAEISLGADPLAPDSNNDGLPDNAEVLDSDRDPDGDGTENLWDDDNDGDGVIDGIDASPFAKTETRDEFHFEVSTEGNGTYLDFQLRPENPMNLMLYGKKYDWPYDTEGQMQDRDYSEEDVQLVPMLELTANLLPDQDNVTENGIQVTTDGKVYSIDGEYTHNDGVGIGNTCGGSTKEIVRADDSTHQITVRSITGDLLHSFDSVYSKGDLLVVADVKWDSLDEIIVFHQSDGLLYLYSGEGHLYYTADADIGDVYSVVAGDVSGDNGKEELIFGPEDGNIIVLQAYENNQGFYRDGIGRTFDEHDAIGLADVDGDGKSEVVVADEDEDTLHIYQYDDTLFTNSEIATISAEFDPYDGLMGAEMLVSSDEEDVRYGEEIIVIRVESGNMQVYTEESTGIEDELEDTGYTEFDGYTTEDLEGDDKDELVVISDTTGVVNVYNAVDQKAYVPLSPVKEDGVTVAFQGRMIYTATGEPVTLTADARLVWFVVGKTDDEEDESANETTVLARYEDDFFLTGFSAIEYSSVTAGLIHGNGSDADDDRDAVSNAYLLAQYHFLYGDDAIPDLSGTLEENGVEVTLNTESDFDYQYLAERWVEETLEDTILPKLAEDYGDGVYPVVFAMDTRYTASDLSDFAGSDGLAEGDSFTADLTSTDTQTSLAIKMNWYDTALDTISPLDIDTIGQKLDEWNYSESEQETAIVNIAIASEGEESVGENYSPMKRNGVGIAFKSGVGAVNVAIICKSAYYLKQARDLRKVLNSGVGQYGFTTNWSKAFQMAKEGGMTGRLASRGCAKLAKIAGGVGKFVKVGGAVSGVAFAAYTFYSVASASDWSGAGMTVGAVYAGMQFGYYVALAMIGSTGPIGSIAAGLVVLSDVITWAITGEGWTDKLMTWIVGEMTEVTDPPDVDLEFDDPDVLIVDYDDNGFDVGDRIEFKCRATEVISKKSNTRTSDMESSYVRPYVQFYDSANYSDSSYRYQITDDLDDDQRTRVWDVGAWVEPSAADTDFSATVKLTAKMKVYYRVCTGDDCDRKSQSDSFEYGETKLVFDVMPGSLEDFIDWSVLTPLDSDDDGIADSEEGGSETWRAVINNQKTEEAEEDVRLWSDGSALGETTEKSHESRFLFEINEEGQFHISERSGGYLSADASMASSAGDESLWDVVPVVDDLYRIINVSLTEDDNDGETWCLAMPEDTTNGVVQVVKASDAPNESLWRIEAEITNTNSGRKDTDNDGLPDRFEADLLSQGRILDGADKDMDDDGLTDKEEIDLGTIVYLADTDGDGLDDKMEGTGWNVTLTYNSLTLTKQVTANPGVADSDGDGLTDDYEKNASPALNPMSRDTDGDGIPDGKDEDPLKPPEGSVDTDYDGLPDEVEEAGWEITVITEGGTVTKTVASDPEEEDTDGDGLTDYQEYKISDPTSADTDGDGLTEPGEKKLGTDVLNYDTDGDGISDGDEQETHGTDPLLADTDSDGLSDGEEINGVTVEGTTYYLDPLSVDTDGDGLSDSDELEEATLTDPTDDDSDNDGLTDGYEIDASETDPLDEDTDDDGLTDYEEVNGYTPSNSNGTTYYTNPLQADTDGDGLTDYEELTKTYGSLSNPSRYDTDKDGLSDYYEAMYEHNISGDYELSPRSPDSDYDGLKDGDEVAMGTDPEVADTDGDGLYDGEEVYDYGTDPLSTDTDGDGLWDSAEVGIEDYQGVRTATDPTDADTDNDGIPDGLDPDSLRLIEWEEILVLYDEGSVYDYDDSDEDMPEELALFYTILGNYADTVDHGTPAEFDGEDDNPYMGDYSYIVMLGEPDCDADEGTVAYMMCQLTDEETRTLMLDDEYSRFATSAVEEYTGLYELEDIASQSISVASKTGTQVEMGLGDSLIVMMNSIYNGDALNSLTKLRKLQALYRDNFVLEAFWGIDNFTIDGVANTNAEIDVTLTATSVFASGSIVAYYNESSEDLLTSDSGLDQGEADVEGDEDFMVDQYIFTETSAYSSLDNLLDNPIDTATLRIYYTALSLDRSLPGDGDCTDALDINENTLAVYRLDGTTWEKLSADSDGVTSITVNTDNVTVGEDDDETNYEGYVEIVTSRLGLFCLAGQKWPDETVDGEPTVTAVSPGEDADDVSLTADITMTFNEEITLADSTDISVDGATIDTIILSDDGLIITITTDERVAGVEYTVVLPANAVEDLSGNSNSEEYSWSFTSIEPENTIPYANDDAFETDEDADITDANAMDDNGSDADSDDNGGTLTVTRVNDDASLVGQTVAGTEGGIFTLAADGALTFSPNGEFEALGSDETVITELTYTLSNGTGTDGATVSVTVQGVNDRPEMDGVQRSFPDIPEDAGDDDGDGSDGDDDGTWPFNNVCYRAGGLLDQSDSVTDIDSTTLGIAVVLADAANGNWQYSSDGETWSDVDSDTTETAALLLGPDYLLRYVPSEDYYGEDEASLTFKVWDESDGSEGETGFDTTSGTSCSTATAAVALTVAPMNDPPEFCVNGTVVMDPGETVAITTSDLKACDLDDDGDGLTFTLTKPAATGAFFVDSDQDGDGESGEGISEGGTFTQADLENGLVLYVHDGSEAATDTAVFSVADGGEDDAAPATGGTLEFLIRTSLDTDGDGMPDWWELQYDLDPETGNGESDTDGDGLPDSQEYIAGTDPTVSDSGPGIPVLVAPEDGATDIEMTPTLETEYEMGSDAVYHVETRWQIAEDDDFAALVFDTTLSDQLTTMTVPNGILESGSVYYWRARYIDTDGAAWGWSDVWSWTTASSFFSDENGNNIPDDQEAFEGELIDLDGDGTHDPDQEGMKSLWIPEEWGDISMKVSANSTWPTEEGLAISVKAGENVTSIDYLAVIDPETLPAHPEEVMEALYGMLNYRISLENVGEPATLYIYLSESLPEDDIDWYRYDTILGWDYEEASLDEERKIITLEREDGSEDDMDWVANGIIVNLDGAYSETDQSSEDGDGSEEGGDSSEVMDTYEVGGGGSGAGPCFIETVFGF